MKHVGLNVAADPFMSSALTGVEAGMVVVVADDPGMHSSQNEQDTRFYAEFAHVPLLEPSSQQEAYDMTRDAFEYSELVRLPVMVRLVTRLAHSRSVVRRRPPASEQPFGMPHRGDPRNWTLLPVNARRQYRRLLGLQSRLTEYSESSPHNQLFLRGNPGILTSGIAANYVSEVLGEKPNCSLLKIGAYPLPVSLIRQLVDHCDPIFVVEEGYPFIEDKLQGLLGLPGRTLRGKRSGDLPLDGELTVDVVRPALNGHAVSGLPAITDIPSRPPSLCAGCPHCDTFRALVEAIDPESHPILFSDIGCYTLGSMPPFNAVHTCVDMGASISMALGAAKAGVSPVVCTIGDSTFTHSGLQPLLSAAYENANMTVIILDNAAVAMTGGQEVFTTGDGLVRLVQALGVSPEHVVKIDPLPRYHHDNATRIREEVQHRGLSVIIASRPCIHMQRRAEKSGSHTPDVLSREAKIKA
jgi:indolepyruvate ferredoxin oxidoreductase alpha subunit